VRVELLIVTIAEGHRRLKYKLDEGRVMISYGE